MEPLHNQVFPDDFNKFVLQNTGEVPNHPPSKPFSLERAEKMNKSKQDMQKEKEKKKKDDKGDFG
jgi:hypothetical protein